MDIMAISIENVSRNHHFFKLQAPEDRKPLRSLQNWMIRMLYPNTYMYTWIICVFIMSHTYDILTSLNYLCQAIS